MVHGEDRYYHLVLLAENNTGYSNLMKIVSKGFVEGYYYKPRVDMEVLEKYHEGIIALSACLAGEVQRNLVRGMYEEAKEVAYRYERCFGKGNFFLELQDHGIPEQKLVNQQLLRMSQETGIELVATNDVHYTNAEDAEPHDILLCLQTGKKLADEDRMRYEGGQYYVKSEEEMKSLFPYALQALENTQKIADRCHVEIEFGHTKVPHFEVPEGYDSWTYLNKLCHEGLDKRYGADAPKYLQKLDDELAVIKNMGYVDYFLIVWDFIHYAREHDIMVGPGRGSAAGSLVSYTTGITDIDPVRYNLIFERFLNPERVSMPDIDVDFCFERRQEVIDYVVEKYGKDCVTQIVTFGTLAARGVIRDVGRVMDLPYNFVDTIAKAIPNELGITIDKALLMNPELRGMYESDESVKKLIDMSRRLEGLPRHTSMHAAGVVISQKPMDEYVPLSRASDGTITTQFTMTTIEELGLLKMDFLGLRTLTVIRDAVRNIQDAHNICIDTDNLKMDDKAVFDMISRGETDGVFQLESSGMKQFMKELKPNSLEDIIAGISLYRPGPMDSIPTYVANKNNPSLVKYKHPMLEHILDVTYGCIVYQEQVMQIVRELGGYSLGRADLVRRAMSKKKADVMKQERQNFIYGVDEDGTHVDGAVARGVDEKTAAAIFDEMMDFASYAFNKSHAAAYAVVAYQTAWLKCHYPVEFFAALLTSFIDNNSKVTKYIEVVKRLGITMLPPSINKSSRTFSVDDGKIRFGLAAVKNVGGSVVDEITDERRTNGRFTGFTDFCERMVGRKLNKRVVEGLIKCGAFDEFGLKRSVLMYEYERVIDSALEKAKNVMPGQIDMFGTLTEMTSVGDNFDDREEYSEKELLDMEKESIGMYVSGHPLDSVKAAVEKNSTARIIDIIENEEHQFNIGSQVTLSGIVTKTRDQLTKKGEIMRYAELEDLSGSIEVIIFPKLLRCFDYLLKEGGFVTISGNLDLNDDTPPKLRLESVRPLDTASGKSARLYLRIASKSGNDMRAVKDILSGAGGSIGVVIKFSDSGEVVKAPMSMMINRNDGRYERLLGLLGSENVKLVEK